jgi:pimeloyl-ACP methyl ester carboxylesterase
VLGAATAERMLAALDRAELVTVPGVGHTPTLSEPEATSAIDRLFDRISTEPAAD